MRSNFNDASRLALKMLKDNGFEAFLIGGAVRDFIMGRELGDIDITTNAEPKEVEKVFADFKVIETGIRHGTVTVLIKDEPVEITTYRLETVYSDNRHPDAVTFSKSLQDDTARRDFTMNGIAYDFENGFLDFVGGKNDIENKIIRCIGDPETRFSEDALRILRAMRFSSVLNFEIEENTEKAIHKCKDLLKNISAERIREELLKLICGQNAYNVLEKFSDVISVFIPELGKCVNFEQKNKHHIYDVYTHIIKSLVQSVPERHIRMALLLHDIGKIPCVSYDDSGEMHFYSHPQESAKMADGILTRLRFDNASREKIVKLIRFHDYPIMTEDMRAPSRKAMKKLMSKLGSDLIFDLLEIKRCDNLSHAEKYIYKDEVFSETVRLAKDIIAKSECLSVKDLKINGYDLIQMGFEGKKIGDILSKCLNAVINEEISNEKDELLLYVKKIFAL